MQAVGAAVTWGYQRPGSHPSPQELAMTITTANAATAGTILALALGKYKSDYIDCQKYLKLV